MRRSIAFRFKGERAYVQGPDMVEAAMREALAGESAPQVSDLVFVMHRMTGRNLDLILDEDEPSGAAPVARLSFAAHGAPRRGILVERAEAPAGARPYDEQELRARCRTDPAARSVVLRGASPLTPLETLVAMTKLLHQALYPETTGQWLFARLEAPRWPLGPLGDGLELRLERAVGTRLTKSGARLGGQILASVFFSLREPA